MGNYHSRDRRQQDGPAGGESRRSYPPAVHQQQQANPRSNYLNNGQFHGGWQATYTSRSNPNAGAPQGPPRPPQAQAQELSQTSTIRNAVNLQKASLRAVPVAGDPSKLAIIFSFDASAPCKVTVFIMVTEDAAHGCQLTTAKQAPAPGIIYQQGLGLMFPKADGVSVLMDVSQYEREALLTPGADTYPLAVRMETITPKGEAEGRTLQDLESGAAQTTWVQSQTTFVGLVEEDGVWLPRVKKQKIWVEGISYELQEIYGMEQAAAGSKGKEGDETAEEAEERLCVICLVNNRDTTVLPCRHMCMCHECAQELRKQTSKCPICRDQVDSLLHIRMQKTQHKTPTGAAAAAAAQKIEELKV